MKELRMFSKNLQKTNMAGKSFSDTVEYWTSNLLMDGA